MREIIHIQIGQAGNNVGSKVSESAQIGDFMFICQIGSDRFLADSFKEA